MEEKMIKDGIEFYPIPNYPKYFISKCGKIISFRRDIDGRYLKLYLRAQVNYYYCAFSFGANDTKTHESLHRLLCLTFIPNPENKPCVNHINAIRTDNRLENLEWATYSENNHHTFVVGNKTHVGSDNVMAREVIDLESGFIYGCIKDASISLNLSYSTFRQAMCNGGDNLKLRKRFSYV